MNPLMLRQLWAVVETTQTRSLITLDDDSLIHHLLRDVCDIQPLNHDELDMLAAYIQTKLPLIRDMADCRAIA